MLRRKKALPPSRLTALLDLPRFDQANGSIAAAVAEERFAESDHTAAPETFTRVSFQV